MREADREQINAALRVWRQGDCALEPGMGFFHGLDPNTPLTPLDEEPVEGAGDLLLVETPVQGFMIATQTCDLVRDCIDRPFLELCPLVEVDEHALEQIEAGRRPVYAFIPGLCTRRLVADLDRVMTVEKAVVAAWTRTPGWSTDAEASAITAALVRKRGRFAFPDDFVTRVEPLRKRLTGKHSKASDEGRMLRALREIRVAPAPSWGADHVISIRLWFILQGEDAGGFDEEAWDHQLNRWLELVSQGEHQPPIEAALRRLCDLSAQQYIESYPLDLDHLSG